MSLSAETPSFTPLFQRLLEKRDLIDPDKFRAFLFPDDSCFHSPLAMKGMAEAVQRIRRAGDRKQTVLVHGDYDVDGITGAAIVTQTLERLGIPVITFLPERAEDGYGVSERALDEAEKKKVSLIITVDCGITAGEIIQKARGIGIDVIVIDHHRIPGAGLPPANVILNPLQDGCIYPFKELSAGGLAFKLAQALLGKGADSFLDLACVSTVCDLAPLIDENRVIVQRGLESLSRRERLGFKVLAEAAKIRTAKINVGHIGFMYGPRINAAGRMSSPATALRLLLTGNLKEAESLAKVLEEENRARQKEEKQVTEQAIREIERTVNFKQDKILVAASDKWHQGVIGIAAARLVERFHRPSVVITFDGEKGKGSGRSIKGVHLFHALTAASDALDEFGGHEMAAGLNIQKGKLGEFRKKLQTYAESLPGEVFNRVVQPDLEITLGDLSAVFLKELEGLEPHGIGNPRPLFLSKNLWIKSSPQKSFYGQIKFLISDGEGTFDAVLRDRYLCEDFYYGLGDRIDMIYSLKTSSFQGETVLQLEVKDITPASG